MLSNIERDVIKQKKKDLEDFMRDHPEDFEEIEDEEYDYIDSGTILEYIWEIRDRLDELERFVNTIKRG